MSKDEIIKLARQAGFEAHSDSDLWDCMVASEKDIRRFAAFVAEYEREACAKIVESYNEYSPPYGYLLTNCIAEIRARGQK
jgi:hypothetical protein